MTPDGEQAELGAMVSEHRHTLTYPIILSVLAMALIAGSVVVAVNTDPVAGSTFGVLAAAGWLLYLWHQGRQKLQLHENGIRLQKGAKASSLLWANVTNVKVSYSYQLHPDTIIDIDFRQTSGPRLVLRMNWTRRKELARRLWPVIKPQPSE